MSKQHIVWTALPHGRVTEGPLAGRWRVSLVASPRLTPETPKEQRLGAFEALLHWPRTLQGLKLGLRIDGQVVSLKPLTVADAATWERLFDAATPVAGFKFQDMSRVNLRSFPVRNVLGFVRHHYGQLAEVAGDRHPTLLPYNDSSPLADLLGALGTRVRKGRVEPGFARFHPGYIAEKETVSSSYTDAVLNQGVFNPESCIPGPEIPIDGTSSWTHSGSVFPVRALPPDWEPPDQGIGSPQRQALMRQFASADEYSFYQADRFYRRSQPSLDDLRLRRPDFKNVDPAVTAPEFDFHRILASFGDYPALLRALGLVIDCVLPAQGTPLDALVSGGADDELLSGRMQPWIEGGDGKLMHSALQTAWQATRHRFVTLPRTGDHRDGLLALQGAGDGSHHVAGAVSVNKRSPFDVYQVDPDGTALKTVDYLLTAQNLIGKSLEHGADGGVTYTTGDAQPVAALRSVGLGVSRHGRAGQVAIDAHAAALKNQAIEHSPAAAGRVVLFTEDVLRGYRIDVQQLASGQWLSLCERSGQYQVLRDGRPLDLPGAEPAEGGRYDDEGYVKSASTTSNGRDDDHYLHESLFRWTGWSLVAPRPGRSLVAESEAGLQTERVATPGEDADIDATADKGNGLAVRFAARKGSLPRLRFGETYRFRARLVDLAGNSLDRHDPSLDPGEQASDPVRFARFEPISPPVLALHQRLSEGESLERMVIRSNYDVPAERYLEQAAAYYAPPPDGSGSPDFEYAGVNVRHVVPPKAAQALCEQHGLFDAALGSGNAAAIKQGYAIAARESGSLLDAVPGARVELVTPQSASDIATVEAPGALIAPPDQADASRDRFAAGQYVVHREDLVPIPYLPDPAAGGIALHGVPGLARQLQGVPVKPLAPGLWGVVLEPGVRAVLLPMGDAALRDPDMLAQDFRWALLIDFDPEPQADDGGWPDNRRSLRIALHDQPAEVDSPACGDELTPADPPKWDPDTRTLHLFLPQGRIARLQYASFVHDRYLSHLGLPQWVAHPHAAGQLRAAALAGAHWMVTPFRRLVLVHATQQPVCEPVLLYAGVARRLGDTAIRLVGKKDNVALHGPSTGQFEVLAEWSEWVDDPAQDDPGAPGPRRVKFTGALSPIRLAENHRNRFLIDHAAEAQRRIDEQAGTTSPQQMAQRADAAGNEHEFGDTRFRLVRYRLRATTRFREYLPPELYAQLDQVSREGPPLDQSRLRVVAHGGGIDDDPGAALLPDNVADIEPHGLVVPASAPPLAPRVVYTLPTFRWRRSGGIADVERISVREGDALRVYLDRPWFSSGDGELLAVVVAAPVSGRGAARFSAIPQALSDRVTQWGLDPLWDSSLPRVAAEAADFPLRVAEASIRLPDGAGSVLAVAHCVAWSAERQLWYCDIEIATGASYMPFVRLALARYQPNALADALLSPIVLADFAQVLPRRRAVLRREGNRVTARLYGPVPMRGPMRLDPRDPWSADSPYVYLTMEQRTGLARELGDNRVELVLQTRDPAIDSDLAWSDAGVLAAGPARPDHVLFTPRRFEAGAEGAPLDVLAADTQAAEVALPSGRSLRFDRAEARTGGGVEAVAEITPAEAMAGRVDELSSVLAPGGPWPWLVPAIWDHTVTLPPPAQRKHARLVLREFERYYSDRSVPESGVASQTRQRRRRIVEERLVYTEFFDL